MALRLRWQESDRAIAEHVGVDNKTVGAARQRLTEEIPQSTTRTGRDGRTINVEKIGKRQPEPEAARLPWAAEPERTEPGELRPLLLTIDPVAEQPTPAGAEVFAVHHDLACVHPPVAVGAQGHRIPLVVHPALAAGEDPVEVQDGVGVLAAEEATAVEVLAGLLVECHGPRGPEMDRQGQGAGQAQREG